MSKTVQHDSPAEALQKRLNDGTIDQQPIWSYIRERHSADADSRGKTAIIDCTREYTYGEMFAEWERYAKVFTGLGITSDSQSRVAVAGVIGAEPLFAFYALNMTGAEVSMFSYPDFLPGGRWRTMLEKEKITDLVISDIIVNPPLWKELQAAKEALGMRNILLIHSKMGGPCIGPAELVFNEYNRYALQKLPDIRYIEDLFASCQDTPIRYNRSDGSRLAIITHTSGTTKGTRKPLPYADSSVNHVASHMKNGFHPYVEEPVDEQLRVLMHFDFSSFLAAAGLVNTTLASGDTLVLTYFGFMHPKFVRAMQYYKIDVLNVGSFMVDRWIDHPDEEHTDFSSVKSLAIGGSYLPVEKLKAYRRYFAEHGYRFGISRGYGMSEAGGTQLLVPPYNDEDILGYAEDDNTVRVKDASDGAFYKISDGERTGVLYLASDSLCSNELDGEILFEYTVIDGQNFLCTNDMVRVNANGSLSYTGRADRYFANNEGREFHAGIVEVQLASHPAVDHCAIVPVLEKRIHDTVPVLYVVPADKGEDAAESIRQALVDRYIRQKKLAASDLPVQFVLVRDIPLNSNGKPDIYRITRERLQGEAYNIKPVWQDQELCDVQTEHITATNSMTAGTVPEGMGGGSALNIFDIFTGS